MSHEPFDTLAAVSALGALDGADRVAFETHLAQGCDRCTATLRESHETLVALARSAPPAVPPPAVKAAVMARIAGAATRTPARRARLRGPLPWIAGTAAAAVAGAALSGVFVAARYEVRVRQLASELAETRRLVDDERRITSILVDPATQIVTLRGLGPGTGASGRLIWHASAGGQLFVTDLAPAPAGHAYELWTIGEGPPRPAGVFRVDAERRATHRVPAAEGHAPVKGFAVTLEPEAGVSAPTGPMVLASAS